MTGWIKLHRSMTEWGWYSDPVVRSVFIHILLSVNIKDTRYMGHDVPCGGLVTGRKKLAETLNFSEMQIRRALKCLKTTNEITIKALPKFSIISVVNWSEYQSGNQQNNQPATSRQPADNQQATTDKEYKNIRSKNIAAKPPDVTIQVWEDFIQIRKNKKAPLTETALKGIRNEATKAGWELQDALAECCQRGWQGFNAGWVEGRAIVKNEKHDLTGWRADLAKQIPASDVAAWFKSASLEGNTLTVDKKFTADWIKGHYAVQIEKVLGNVTIEVKK